MASLRLSILNVTPHLVGRVGFPGCKAGALAGWTGVNITVDIGPARSNGEGEIEKRSVFRV